MQNLKDHFNTTVRRERQKALRKRDIEIYILWLWLLFLIEEQRKLSCEVEKTRYPAFRPG